MKTKLPSSSNTGTKSIVKCHGIFSFLFILLMTVSSFGQSFIINSDCTVGPYSDLSFQFDTQNTTGDNIGSVSYIDSVSMENQVLATDWVLRVELAGIFPNNYDRWEVQEPGGERWFYTTDANLITDPCNATWTVDTVVGGGRPCTDLSICPSTWYEDSDIDTYGNPDVSQVSTTQPTGYVSDNTDCDDNDATVNATTTYYVDNDGDGFGTTADDLCVATAPAGYATVGGDCDDNDATEFPGQTWYLGVDNDGDTYFGSQLTADCENPGGYSLTPPTIDDCNDTLNSGEGINPGATEICDGIDNNCDGGIDEGLENQGCFQYEYCGDIEKQDKIIICHNGKDICVSINALDAHYAHGDNLRSCSSVPGNRGKGKKAEELPTSYDVAFWPNPSKNNFNVKMITPNVTEKVSIEAFDINGRLVHSNLINGNENYQFGNQFSTGIYIVKLTQENTTKMIKVVKQ